MKHINDVFNILRRWSILRQRFGYIEMGFAEKGHVSLRSVLKMDAHENAAGIPVGSHLKVRWTVVEQFQHVLDVLRLLDNEVQLHIELAAHQLEQFVYVYYRTFLSMLICF